MHMSVESLLIILFDWRNSARAGWLAKSCKEQALVWLEILLLELSAPSSPVGYFPQLGIHLGAGIVAAIIAATIGAVLLLVMWSS